MRRRGHEQQNEVLFALLENIDRYRADLAESNAAYRAANDRFEAFLRRSGVPLSVPPPPRRR